MSKTHTVKQGECLSSIAHLYGFSNWRTLYDHPDNDSLRTLRPNPNVLFPGDIVTIPERNTKQEQISPGQTHKFKVKVPKTFLHLEVLDGLDGQSAQARYSLELEGLREPLRGEIGANGQINVKIPANARNGKLTLFHLKTDDILAVIVLQIGALDPAATLSGVRQRLCRLGFSCPKGNGSMDPETEVAVRAFQHRYGLTEDGIPGKQTQAKLEELVGA
jgi:N-acetylmuramoyl-L-alanine amidase